MARPRSITDEQIKDAARAIFVEHGPQATVKQIADRLGVTHAALFARAGSKEQLMNDALLPAQPRAVKRLAEAPPEAGVDSCLVEILVDLMEFFQQVVPNLVVLKASGRSLAGVPEGGGLPPPVALRRALARWLDRAVRQGSLMPMPSKVEINAELAEYRAKTPGGPDKFDEFLRKTGKTLEDLEKDISKRLRTNALVSKGGTTTVSESEIKDYLREHPELGEAAVRTTVNYAKENPDMVRSGVDAYMDNQQQSGYV